MTTSRVTVYTKPACVQCSMTIKELEKLNIPYKLASLEDEPDKVQEFKDQGLLSAPVLVPADGSTPWAGFIPAKIKSLAQNLDK